MHPYTALCSSVPCQTLNSVWFAVDRVSELLCFKWHVIISLAQGVFGFDWSAEMVAPAAGDVSIKT